MDWNLGYLNSTYADQKKIEEFNKPYVDKGRLLEEKLRRTSSPGCSEPTQEPPGKGSEC